MSVHAQARRLRLTCTIASVNPADPQNGRIDVVSGHPCAPLYPLQGYERERYKMATSVRAFRTYVKPGPTITARMRFLIAGADYRIRDVTPVPAGSSSPSVVELILEDEGI